jgi:ABC-type multidrug transport system fused ATPase/permease subunit
LDLPLIATLVVFLMRFFPVVGQALNMLLRIVADTKAARDVTRLIREYPSLTDDVGRPAIGPIQHVEARALAFEHVPDNPVLREFGVRLERGKSYALMGLSGSGKSTLLDLMLGFYPVGKGMLLVNGLAITDVAIAELRRRILVVTQDPTIFNDTVANNIRFGATASDADVERAARIAGIDDFIATLPHGYQTLIAYRGANLSGGQRQRIGIARAVLRSPDVLLLDESTSALDADTRETVVNNLLTEWRDRIILFVTHDTFVASKVSEVLDMAELNRAIVAPDARATRAAVARERIE